MSKDSEDINQIRESLPYDFSILRVMRKREGLTISQVAERSGVSVAVISKLERNQTSAELETIYRLARVFGISASDLLGLAEARMAHRKRGDHYRSGDFDFNRIQYNNMNCFISEAPAGAEISRPEIHQDDYEMCWVLNGHLQLTLPHEVCNLKTGDSVQFDAILEHTYKAVEDVKFILVHIRKHNRF